MSSKEKNQAPGGRSQTLGSFEGMESGTENSLHHGDCSASRLGGGGGSHELGAYKGVHLRFVHVTARVP